MNSNVRLHLSSLLSKEPCADKTARVFGRQITNECGQPRSSTFFRQPSKSLINNHQNKTLEIDQSDKRVVQHTTQPSILENFQMTQYAQEIYQYLVERESSRSIIDPHYLEGHSDITSKMRASLIDWLIDVHHKFKLLPETLFKTIILIDRYLAAAQTTSKKLQLVGTTALFIACKYEQIYPPSTRSFVELISKQYYLEDIIDMEGKILKALDFDLTYATPNMHVQRLFEIYRLQPKETHFCCYLLELCLLEPAYLKYTPSVLATSALFLMRVIYKKSIQVKINDIGKQCAKQMVISLQSAPKNSYQASRIKYASKAFSEVSRITIRPNNTSNVSCTSELNNQ